MVVNALRMKCFKPPIWGATNKAGKSLTVIDICTNMPVCAFACRFTATYLSCSQAGAVNTKRRLLHTYPTNCPTFVSVSNSACLLRFVAFRCLTALCFGFVSDWYLWPINQGNVKRWDEELGISKYETIGSLSLLNAP